LPDFEIIFKLPDFYDKVLFSVFFFFLFFFPSFELLKKVEIFAPKKEILVEITPQKKKNHKFQNFPQEKNSTPKGDNKKMPKFLLIFISFLLVFSCK